VTLRGHRAATVSPLDSLAHACAGGDLAGCDALYWVADEFSDHEEYGSTCGGRSRVEYEGSCDAAFD
jgi:hypothetical protein